MRATGAESGSETGEEENQPAIPHIEFMKTGVDVTWRRDRGSSENDLYLEIREEFFYLESKKAGRILLIWKAGKQEGSPGLFLIS